MRRVLVCLTATETVIYPKAVIEVEVPDDLDTTDLDAVRDHMTGDDTWATLAREAGPVIVPTRTLDAVHGVIPAPADDNDQPGLGTRIRVAMDVTQEYSWAGVDAVVTLPGDVSPGDRGAIEAYLENHPEVFIDDLDSGVFDAEDYSVQIEGIEIVAEKAATS